ncbi:MAG TPA: quinone-dependent dihydroorotate dehydrogenase [Spongiibacteraceae bacterium]|jgi:dihydroorotate dehydrogenase|nr:quinone-dependent dihydroorotate dehydrogenase [Spongiibacteraceae bacterium]HUH36797.1 quinone-dependent dihydroorotate dehydrogenase [Spongiibacteraceae bacterium]
MYRLLRPLLFQLAPETAHHLTLSGLAASERLGLPRLLPALPPAPRTVMGIEFPNPVGLAAGLDKNGECIAGLAALGFGFVEIGTVTPRPQPGNPQPRLFRLPAAEAIINRMGFNNAGVEALIANVRASRYKGVLGINIGKNKDTPAEQAADDYLHCLDKVYAQASYITVNLSSPNTPGLRDLQFGEPLNRLLGELKQRQARLAQAQGRYVPLAVKIAPDMAQDDLARVAESLLAHELDGVIATNTTISRAGVAHLPHGDEAGGLSGAPLTQRSTQVVSQLAAILAGRLPIIGVGGICSAADARAKLDAGASLVQLYSGLIYRGPALVRDCVRALR